MTARTDTSLLDCPLAEQLAAFADGRLAGAEREQVEAHVAECEDCFEQLAGALELKALRAAQAPREQPVPLPPPQRHRWLLGLAAVLAIGLGVGIVVTNARTRSDATTAVASLRWADELGAGATLAEASRQAWIAGAEQGFGAGVDRRSRAFRLGVHLLDARVADRAGDPSGWQSAVHFAEVLLGDDARDARKGEASDVERDVAAARASRLAEMTARARVIAPAAFDLGAWSESGRLAALAAAGAAGEAGGAGVREGALPALLTDPNFWTTLAELRRDPELAEEPAVPRALERVASLRPGAGASREALQRLADACEHVILLH